MPELDFTLLKTLRKHTRWQDHARVNTLIGRKFGRITPFGCMGANEHGHSVWLCRCDCGDFIFLEGVLLTRKRVMSCGKYSTKQYPCSTQHKHGYGRTRVYNIWSGVLSRCYDSKCESYKDYGGRGIKVCERWHRFENFLADMGQPPSSEYSLGRTDNDGDYEPSNCKWSDRFEQARNTRRNRFLTVNDQAFCLAQWAELTGVKQGLIAKRLLRGWSTEEALEFKERPKRQCRN